MKLETHRNGIIPPSGIPCGTWGTVITRRGFIIFKTKCYQWDCNDCGNEFWNIWEAKIDIVWGDRDRFYVGLIQKERSQLSRWLAKVEATRAIKVYAGKDCFLVISDTPFPSGQRMRKKKTLRLAKRHLFAQIDHSQNRKIVATKRFRSVIKERITSILQQNKNNNNGSTYHEIYPKALLVAKWLKMGVVNSGQKALAHAWKKIEWKDLDRKWNSKPDDYRAAMLRELSERRLIRLTNEGKELIEQHSFSEVIIEDVKNLVIIWLEKMKEEEERAEHRNNTPTYAPEEEEGTR